MNPNIGNPNGSSFFDGCVCPISFKDDMHFKQKAMTMLKEELKKGTHLNELKEFYHNQMKAVKNSLLRICGVGNIPTYKNLAQWSAEMQADETTLCALWYTNVYILLKLKVIENDINNGMLFLN